MNVCEVREIFSAEEIAIQVKMLGKQIDLLYKDEPLVLIGVLKGAVVFCADLLRALNRKSVEIDFVCLSSYGMEQVSSQKMNFSKDISTDLQGKHVLLVEDIVDTGRSMQFLMQRFEQSAALSVRSAVLIDKHERREVDFTPDFVGFRIAGGFIVGYGLDFAEQYRSLPGLYELIIE